MREGKQDPFCTFLYHLLAPSSPALLIKGILADTRLTLSCTPLLLKPCTSQGYSGCAMPGGCCARGTCACLTKLWAQPRCQLPLLQMG